MYTGDVSGAGTDANVFMTLFGEKGDSGERKLHKSDTYKDKFERGHVRLLFVIQFQAEYFFAIVLTMLVNWITIFIVICCLRTYYFYWQINHLLHQDAFQIETFQMETFQIQNINYLVD